MGRMKVVRCCRCLAVVILLGISRITVSADPASNQLLRVDESALRLHLLPQANLELPLLNTSGKPLACDLTIQLADFAGNVNFSQTAQIAAAPGATVTKIALLTDRLTAQSPSALGWNLLSYSIRPRAGSAFAAVQGILQAALVIRDSFELRMSAPNSIAYGGKFPVTAWLRDPANGRPYAGAPIKIELRSRNGTNVLHTERLDRDLITDAQGYVHTEYDLPADTTYTVGEVYAEATVGGFHEFQQLGYSFEKKPRINLNTDKSIYQPGQSVHLRALAIGTDKRPRVNTKVIFKITNRAGGEEFHATVITSKFGVAAADWEIPQKAVDGDYRIEASCAPSAQSVSPYEDIRVEKSFRIGKYELPQFVVEAIPDRSYYLPGQDAMLEVRAHYLTGQPVLQAIVDVPNATMEHGKLDDRGKFVVPISLQKSFAQFRGRPQQHFEDNVFTAYITDLSTGRTQSRRFTVRLSHEPVHLYLRTMHHAVQADESSRFSFQYLQALEPRSEEIYVMSSYADGAPASVSGTIAATRPAGTRFTDNPDSAHRAKLVAFHTNRYGVGRVELPALRDDLTLVEPRYHHDQEWSPLPSCGWGAPPGYVRGFPPQHRAQLLLRASDQSGRSGTHQEQVFVLAPEDFIQVSTDHALYHPGEPIRLRIVSNTAISDVLVNAYAKDGVVSSHRVPLHAGRATLTVPYNPRLRGKIEVRAFALNQRSEYNQALHGAAEVIYPQRQELQVGVKLQHTTFAPGEMVNAELKVRTPEGEPGTDDLGILGFDRAVAEQTRDDNTKASGFEINDYFDARYSNSLAGFTFRDLLNLEPASAFPEGLDVVAEAHLKLPFGDEFDGYRIRDQLASTGFNPRGLFQAMPYPNGEQFARSLRESLEPVRNILYSIYQSSGRYPLNETELSAELEEFGLSPDRMRDMWGVPYRAEFTVDGMLSVLRLLSDGPDKKPDTGDEFVGLTMTWPYFQPIGSAIDAATVEFHKRTGGYIRDYAALDTTLKAANIHLDSLRDAWGNPYTFTFDVKGPFYVIEVDSPGPNKKFDDKNDPYRDDLHLWSSRLNYFQELLDQLNQAISGHFARTGQFPLNEKEMLAIVDEYKIAPDRLIDPWGHRYRFGFRRASEYGDRSGPVTSPAGKMNQVTPTTQNVLYLQVESQGPEPGHAFSLAQFRKVLSEQTSKDEKLLPTPEAPPTLEPVSWGDNANPQRPTQEALTFEQNGGLERKTPGVTGIEGMVNTATASLPVAGAAVTAISSTTGKHYNTTAGKGGLYTLNNLPPGQYRLEFTAMPLAGRVVTDVPLNAGNTAVANVQLKSGPCVSDVLVTGAATAVRVSDQLAIFSPLVNETSKEQAEIPLFTPRVRRYFPETLLWQPEVFTDSSGTAHVSFPMADSLTAWTMSVVASSEDGQVGVAQLELRSFQPFFIENDPPRVLTQGDQISLPVVFRNYSKEQLSIQAELEPQSWFTTTSGQQKVTILPDRNATAFFNLRADSSVRHGKAKVVARNTRTGDAVEREVRVHPDGQEVAFSTAKLLAGDDNSFEIQLPQEEIEGSNDTELRIYPNMVAHMLDAIASLGEPPSGCMEPEVSKGYMSLLTLEILSKAGQANDGANNPRAVLAAESKAWVQSEYQSLVASQNADGGFSSWEKKSSVAITAYVLIFLRKAENFISIDQNVITRAGNFLARQQTKSGAWLTESWWRKAGTEDENLTSYVARSLAAATTSTQRLRRTELDKALGLAMDYLEARINSWSDAWLVGNYGIAAGLSGRSEYMQRARDYLGRLSHAEGATTYWELEANASPFDTWGKPGRIETTALAAQALSLLQARSVDAVSDEQIRRALQFLLSHKDAAASWYSMHSTATVVEAIIAAMPRVPEENGGSQARVVVNGTVATTLELPPPEAVVGPVTLELEGQLAKGTNKFQIIRSGGAGAINVTARTTYYSPWISSASSSAEESLLPGESRALRLKVHYDKTGAQLGQLVTCHVEAARIGFRGYGVMQVEIGLPPGANVAIESLKYAPVHRIQPDRIVFYVWPYAEGSTFDFQFRLRYPIDALSGPSTLYDYYNPESQATIRPVKFSVHPVSAGSR